MLDYRSQELPDPTSERKRPAWLSFLFEVIQTLVLAIVLYFLIDMVIGRVRVENVSMQPTLYEGQFLIVNKLAYRTNNFHRGDVVVFHNPRNLQEDYIKRVIGVPGDRIEVSNGSVKVNSQQMEETYIAAPPAYVGSWEVPQGSIFVLGDNRNQSSDSHSWGFVPEEDVIGKALAVYWPLDKMKLLNQAPMVVNAAQ